MPTQSHYFPAIRLQQVRAILDGEGGATLYDLADRLDVSTRTAERYLAALEASGVPLYDDLDGRKKVWRLMPTARGGNLTLTTGQMVTLFLCRRVFDFLAGTGFKEDLDEIFHKLEATLKRKDLQLARNLDRKFLDVNEAPHKYEHRIEDVNDLLTALLREDRLLCRHMRVLGGRRAFLVDPYTLLVYKKGLYLVGYSHHHQAIHRFDLDDFRAIDWQKGNHFDYPADYRPTQITEGPFGITPGPAADVRIFFTEAVARYLRRRRWHATQKIHRVKGGIEVTMSLKGTAELRSWVLSFGDQAKVLEPPELQKAIREEMKRALARYEGE